MTNLSNLSVSLTKFGAFKLATLLQHFDSKQILSNVWGSRVDANVEKVQAKKTLAVGPDGVVPTLWDDARKAGVPTLEALVLIAMIASHGDLIKAMQRGAIGNSYSGTLKKGLVLHAKGFTNFKRALEELGFATRSSPEAVSYNLGRLLAIPNLNLLAAELLTLKLRSAGWDEKNSLEDELVALGFQKVFACTEPSFRSWINSGHLVVPPPLPKPETDFFQGVDDRLPTVPFKFKKGHTPKKTGVVKVTAPTLDAEAELLHNSIQTKLYNELVKQYGADSVGTENNSGSGTAIDLVVETSEYRWFYEIKTASSVKACIRQAIPQLLEYAYWQCILDRAQRLVIVGPMPITPEGAAYLEFLRNSFELELYYEHCSV